MVYIRNFLIAFILVFFAIGLLMLLPSPQPNEVKPWDITMMPDGNVEFLGIHLNNTTYAEAQKQLHLYGEAALFSDPDGKLSAEAFFPSINLAGLSAKLVLGLAIEQDDLKKMIDRAAAGKLQPSMARQYELSELDKPRLVMSPVSSVTYIPSVRLTEEMLVQRFGEPESKQMLEQDESGEPTTKWSYPLLNMNALLKPGHKTVLLIYSR